MPRRTAPAIPSSPTVLDLFSGIGLGLHWAGMRTAAFCESDPFARSILQRRWPGVPVYDDIRTLTAARLRDDGVPPPWLVCGGFPCQDVSLAGRGAGIEGTRTGLWSHMARLVAECRPRWVVAENVPGLRGRGADRVLHDLESAGYACWPLVVGAVHAGAPHRRARVWLVAQSPAADAGGEGLEMGKRCAAGPAPCLPVERRGGWPAESVLRRMDDGIPTRLDQSGRERVRQLHALGNAVVPQNAAMLGRAVLAASPEWTTMASDKGRHERDVTRL
jgi:DNA (cytosine-5)-methyltransferase 1